MVYGIKPQVSLIFLGGKTLEHSPASPLARLRDPLRRARSFFFWMDALGTVSMIFEISSLLGPGGKMQTSGGGVDATLIRVARVAKVHGIRGKYGNA